MPEAHIVLMDSLVLPPALASYIFALCMWRVMSSVQKIERPSAHHTRFVAAPSPTIGSDESCPSFAETIKGVCIDLHRRSPW